MQETLMLNNMNDTEIDDFIKGEWIVSIIQWSNVFKIIEWILYLAENNFKKIDVIYLAYLKLFNKNKSLNNALINRLQSCLSNPGAFLKNLKNNYSIFTQLTFHAYQNLKFPISGLNSSPSISQHLTPPLIFVPAQHIFSLSFSLSCINGWHFLFPF